MPYYCVQSRTQAGPMRTYWVQAKSAALARTLVALNVAAAVDAVMRRCSIAYRTTQKASRRPDLQRH